MFIGDPVVEGVLELASVEGLPGGVVWVIIKGARGFKAKAV